VEILGGQCGQWGNGKPHLEEMVVERNGLSWRGGAAYRTGEGNGGKGDVGKPPGTK